MVAKPSSATSFEVSGRFQSRRIHLNVPTMWTGIEQACALAKARGDVLTQRVRASEMSFFWRFL